MNYKSMFGGAAAVLLLAASAFATNLHVSRSINFNGQEIQPGDYQVTYTGNGPEVDVSLTKGKKVVAQTKARLEQLDSKSPYDAFVTNDAGATPVVTRIQFAGKKQVLVLPTEQTEMHPMGK